MRGFLKYAECEMRGFLKYAEYEMRGVLKYAEYRKRNNRGMRGTEQNNC